MKHLVDHICSYQSYQSILSRRCGKPAIIEITCEGAHVNWLCEEHYSEYRNSCFLMPSREEAKCMSEYSKININFDKLPK